MRWSGRPAGRYGLEQSKCRVCISADLSAYTVYLDDWCSFRSEVSPQQAKFLAAGVRQLTAMKGLLNIWGICLILFGIISAYNEIMHEK